MGKYDDIKREISELKKAGTKLFEAIDIDKNGNTNDLMYFISNYEVWYSKAQLVVKQILPSRFDDFISQYNIKQRKQITAANYTISDALRALKSGINSFNPSTARFCMARQVFIIQSCLEIFDSKIQDIQTIVQADIFDSEIEASRYLSKRGFLRAAGAICGVVIEKHLKILCDSRSLKSTKKNPSIADYNEMLKDNAYDTLEWRKIQRLADIRNLCDHNKEREPTKDEVEELISGTDRVVKTLF